MRSMKYSWASDYDTIILVRSCPRIIAFFPEFFLASASLVLDVQQAAIDQAEWSEMVRTSFWLR